MRPRDASRITKKESEFNKKFIVTVDEDQKMSLLIEVETNKKEKKTVEKGGRN